MDGGVPPIRKAWLIANPASGSVGPTVLEEASAILAAARVEAQVRSCQETPLSQLLEEAMADHPDLLVVVAGDGTARAAGEAAGPYGPLVAPLPGGTMNMLPKAIYGDRTWQQALTDILADGEVRNVSGGKVGNKAFYVAAILGAPALWARAREAMRDGDIRKAIQRARLAFRRGFSGRLRFSLDGRQRDKAEALTVMCPLISKAMDDDAPVLEAAALDPVSALDVFRLAANAALGDWRRDPSVEVTMCRQAACWASGPIPAVLDGEPVMLERSVTVRFTPVAFRALAPREKEPEAEPNDEKGPD